MGTYTYTINTIGSQQDGKSYTGKRVFKIKACENSFIQNNLDELWNNNLCAQDEAYCQPWVAGDKLYFQFTNDRDESFSKIVKLINKETGAIISTPGIITTQDGFDENGTAYYNVIVDTTNIDICCFYLRVSLFFCEPDPSLLSTCITTGTDQGKSLDQATYDCMVEFCNEENIVEVFSEPFCKVICEPTLLIQGTYPKYDCDSGYHGLFDDDYNPDNSYTLSFRIPGEINQENYQIAETIVNEDKTASKMTSSYRLMTPKIPPYVARQIANCFNAQVLTIDGIEYKRGVAVEKNNDQGNMWIINSQLLRICDNIDFTCE